MLSKDNIEVIGTSHVSAESLELIKKKFAEFKPDIIAVELDKQRYFALKNKQQSKISIGAIRTVGLTGFIFVVIGRIIQKKLGDIAGMNPGEEMLLGTELARNNKLILALIDQDVHITLRNLSKKVKFKEKMRIITDILFAPFKRNMPKITIDIKSVPKQELIVKLLTMMKGRYPGFHRVLLEERNAHMARKIYDLMRMHPEKKILAIVGAGHVEGMRQHLDSLVASNVY